jgi:exosortase/archaeosortase family protein
LNHLATIASGRASANVTSFVSRGELFLWVAACLFVNQAVLLIHVGSFSQLVTDLENQNLVYWFGCYVVLFRLHASGRRERASPYDWCFALTMLCAVLVSSFIAYRFAIGFLASAMGLYLLALYRADEQLKSAGTVLLALSAHLAWGPILFLLVTPELLRADAALVGGLLMLVNPAIVWTGTTFQSAGGHTISIVGACSSFENLSTALLACAAAAMFVRTRWTRRDIAAMVVASVAMVFLNAMRLCLLAWNTASYQFWHEGQGAPLYGCLTSIVMLLIAFWSARARGSRA